MAIKLVVAVTDWDWFNHLRRLPDPPEVNFWAPSNTGFKALSPGELFLFKLHAPRNQIVGGGIFTHATSLPCSGSSPVVVGGQGGGSNYGAGWRAFATAAVG